MELPLRLLGAVGTSAALDRCIFSCCIHFSMFRRCFSKLSIRFRSLKTFRDHRGHLRGHKGELAAMVDPKAVVVYHFALGGSTTARSICWPGRCLYMSSETRNRSITCSRVFKTSKNRCSMKKYIDYVPQKSPQFLIVAERRTIKKTTCFP